MAKRRSTKDLTTEAQVEQYNLLSPVLNAISRELKELSKKKQDGVLSKLKVGMINKILEPIKQLLSGEPTAQFLELLDDETLPTNSDAVLVLAKVQAAMDQFSKKYHRLDKGRFSSRWSTTENP